MANGLNLGLRRSYWGIAGLQVGLMTQLAPVAVGLGAIPRARHWRSPSSRARRPLYLIYLAIAQWRSAGLDPDRRPGQSRCRSRCTAGTWRTGQPDQLKGLVFLLAVLPQFVVPDRATATAVPGDRRHHDCRRRDRDERLYAGLARQTVVVAHPASADRAGPDVLRLFATAAVVLSLVRQMTRRNCVPAITLLGNFIEMRAVGGSAAGIETRVAFSCWDTGGIDMTTAAIPPVPLRCPDRFYIDGDRVAPAGDSMFDDRFAFRTALLPGGPRRSRSIWDLAVGPRGAYSITARGRDRPTPNVPNSCGRSPTG